jgi:hypothetical protein
MIGRVDPRSCDAWPAERLTVPWQAVEVARDDRAITVRIGGDFDEDVFAPQATAEVSGRPGRRSPPTLPILQSLRIDATPVVGQYSFLSSKKEPRMVPASFDFCLANLNREASSAGTSIPSQSLNPTARFLGSSTAYITLIDRPLS